MSESNVIPVPERLRNTHPTVRTTREAAKKAALDEQQRVQVWPNGDSIRLSVSRGQMRRALLILQAICDESHRRGHRVANHTDRWGKDHGGALTAKGHAYPIAISEETDRVALSAEEIERWRKANRSRLSWTIEPTEKRVPNGRLRLSFDTYRSTPSQKSWGEGPRGTLETKLPSVFTTIERWTEEDVLLDEQRAREEQERERRAAERIEAERLARIQQSRAKRLSDEIANWRLAQEALAYSASLRERIRVLADEDRSRIATWCDWIEHWVSVNDPHRNVAQVAGLDVGPESKHADETRTPSWAT